MLELLEKPTTIPPIIPAIIPENSGAPDAREIPKHKGSAIRNTTRPAEISVTKCFLMNAIFSFIVQIDIFWGSRKETGGAIQIALKLFASSFGNAKI